MSVMVIEWDRQRAIVATGDAIDGKAVFRSVRAIDWSADGPEPGTALEKLRDLFPAASSNVTIPVILVFPRQSVTIHRLQLPHAPAQEIPDMVRLQAITRLTVPVDSVCLDFAPLPTSPNSESRDVLLVTVPLEQVNAVRRVLKGCRLELAEVRVSSFTIAAAAAAAGFLNHSEDISLLDALVLMRDDFIEVTFVRGQSVVYAHSGSSWTAADGIERAVRSELNRARMAAVESLGEYRLSRLILIGSPEITAAVSDQIAGRMNDATVVRIDPSASFLSGEFPASIPAASLVAVAGALTGKRTIGVEQVDLINPRRAPEVRDLRRAKILASILAATVLFAVGWVWRQNKIQGLQSAEAALQERVVELRDALQLGELDMTTATQVADWVSRDISWLDTMSQLKKQLPGTDRMIVRGFQFAVKEGVNGLGTIRIEGKAKSAADVESLARKLVDAGYTVDPYKPTASLRDPAYPTEITLMLTVPVPAAPADENKTKEEKT